jgi:RNA polymerase sigma-70 factor (ECF subfamily)
MELETQLLDDLKDGDEQALARLYEHFSARVFALALELLQSREEAEEVLQDTFVKLYRKADGYRADLGSPRAFIYTIARNEALNRLRARRARPKKVDGWDVHDPSATFTAATADPLQSIMVERALKELGDEDRQLVRQAFFRGYSHGELAERTGLPLGTVKSRLRRSLLQLREYLGEA